MSKTIGVIGLGSIGMRHAKNLLAMGHHVIGFDPIKVGEGFPSIWPPVWMRMRELHGVVISSPTETHLDHFTSSVERKIPALIEKPISDKWATAVEEVLTQAKAPVMMGNNLRFHSCVKKAKEWLAEGLIGKPLWASFCVAQKNTKYTDPVVLNWGAHEFDLALYLLGPATVTAAAGNDQIFDTCLLHEYGVPSTIHCDYVTAPERRSFFIGGDRGVMSVSLADNNALLFSADGRILPMFHGDGFDQSYKDEMQAFIDLIDGKPVPHAATGEDGLHALELILEAQRMAS